MRIKKPLLPLHPVGLRRHDNVVVLTGDDKGKQGRVLRLLSRRDQVVIEGVNMVVKHKKSAQRRTAVQLQQGRFSMPAPIARSKVMLICPRCNRPTRVTMELVGERRARACKKCKEFVDAN